jgi:hypothetical protein
MPIEKVKLTNNELGLKEKINEIIDRVNELDRLEREIAWKGEEIGLKKEILRVVKETMLELMDTDVAIRHKFGCREDHSLDRIGGWKNV